MQRIEVEGGHPLKGVIRPSGNKNAALPIIAATLLTRSTHQLSNVPATSDVLNMLQYVSNLGGIAQLKGDEVEISCPSAKESHVGPPLPTSMQASLLLAAPLLHQRGEARLEPLNPAKERLTTHFKVLVNFDIQIQIAEDVTTLRTPRRIEAQDVLLDEASVTATELAILLAVCARGTTTLRNAACEPHVQDLIAFLNACGADIQGSGTNFLRIRGVENLHSANYRLSADHIEVGSFVAMAAMTQGQIVITDVEAENMQAILNGFQKLGINTFWDHNNLQVPVHTNLRITDQYISTYPKIASAPWPGFPTDLIPLMATVASQASGTILIHEKLYDSRMFFLDSLISMGANAIQCDPHRAVISGPNRLHAAYLETPDIRTGLALLGAALIADGTSIIEDVQVINRIFDDAIGKLTKLGAVIRRLD